jgi:hypothetical protein
MGVYRNPSLCSVNSATTHILLVYRFIIEFSLWNNTAILAFGLHILVLNIRRRFRDYFIWELSRVLVRRSSCAPLLALIQEWERVLPWRRLAYAVHVLTLQCSTPSSDVTDYAL